MERKMEKVSRGTQRLDKLKIILKTLEWRERCRGWRKLVEEPKNWIK